MKTLTILALALAALSLAPAAGAQNAADHAAHTVRPVQTAQAAQGAAPAAAGPMQEAVDGEVRKVDLDARKLTLRHGPIAAFDMPGMTMVFQVREPAMLEGLKTGDKVKFKVDKVNGQFTVTELAPAGR